MSTAGGKGNEPTSSLLGSALLGVGMLLLLLGERVLPSEARLVGSGAGVALVLLALGMRVATVARVAGAVRVVEGRLLLAGVGVLLALLTYGASTPPGLVALGLQASERAPTLLAVGFACTLLLSVGALGFMELAYLRMPSSASVETARVGRAAQAGLSLSLSIVLLMSLNYVASERDVRRDVTYFKTSQPGPDSLAMIGRLDAEVEAVLFFEARNAVLPQVRSYFEALAEASPRFSVRVVDFDMQPELARRYKVRGNGQVLLLTGEGQDRQGKSFKIGTELTVARASLKRLDALFQEHFARATRSERTVYLTVGHGERGAPEGGAGPVDRAEGLQGMESVLARLRLKRERLGIREGLGAAVPDESSAVVVMGPQRAFTDFERRSLGEYVRRGGRLLLMLDPQVDSGLSPLLAELGLRLEAGVVASTTQHMRFGQGLADRAIVFTNSYSSHPTVTNAMRNQRDVASVFFRAAALGKLPGPAQQGARAGTDGAAGPPVVRFPVRGRGFFLDRDGDYVPDEGEAAPAIRLMAAVTVPVAAANDDGGSSADGPATPAEGRVVVIGDGDFITDRLAGNRGNMMVFVDVLGWLIGDEALPATAQSEQDVPIRHSRDEDRLWFYATTFAVPLPILVLGLWNARRRRRRTEAA